MSFFLFPSYAVQIINILSDVGGVKQAVQLKRLNIRQDGIPTKNKAYLQ